jgi:DNA-binding PadR family transcriptional regulator
MNYYTIEQLMYELLIFTLLVRRPFHGYLIAKIINDTIGPLARLSNGRLYPLLSKLEEQGLIEATKEVTDMREGNRPIHRYQITEAGRNRLRELMLDVTSNPGDYSKYFNIKVTTFDFLSLKERLHLIDHYIYYCQTHIMHLNAESEDLIKHTDKPDYDLIPLDRIIEVMQHRTRNWQAELDWAKSLREKEIAQNTIEN